MYNIREFLRSHVNVAKPLSQLIGIIKGVDIGAIKARQQQGIDRVFERGTRVKNPRHLAYARALDHPVG
jgi:hypothetical protein